MPQVRRQGEGVRDEVICTEADIATFLGKAATITDGELNAAMLIQPQVENSIKETLGYKVEQATYTHFLPETTRTTDTDRLITSEDVVGNRVVPQVRGGLKEDAYLYLPEIPVRSVANIFQDTAAYGGQGADDFPAASELTAGVDYMIDFTESGLARSGKLIKISGGAWSIRGRTIKVVYTAGYTATELATGIAAAIKQACLLGIQAAFNDQGDTTGKVKSERLGDWAATYAVDGVAVLPTKSLRLLQPFVRYSRFN